MNSVILDRWGDLSFYLTRDFPEISGYGCSYSLFLKKLSIITQDKPAQSQKT
ncbi:hypothetical protein BDGGKGIB_01826 [Nodularia sphaerocarpa UHCC 0038]|nr:hypothetical protein BDGGKGIB_01826 [Nodularia sphaerocarpa UHCC 0038]